MQALAITFEDQRNVAAEVSQAVGLAPRLREDTEAVLEMCDHDPRVMGRGRTAVELLRNEAEAIRAGLDTLRRDHEAFAQGARARGSFTRSDLESVTATVTALVTLSEAATRLKLRAQGAGLRLVK